MNTMHKTIAIEDGPSVDRLFDAIKYAYEENSKIKVGFSVAKSYLECTDNSSATSIKLKMGDVKLVGICHESGDSHSYILRGYCSICEDGKSREVPFKAYYNARTRKGHVTPLI